MTSKHIFNIFILTEFCEKHYGKNYPIEIIHLIMMISHTPTKSYVGDLYAMIHFDKKIHLIGSKPYVPLNYGMIASEPEIIGCGRYNKMALMKYDYTNGLYEIKANYFYPIHEKLIHTPTIRLKNIKKISCGKSCAFVLTRDGDVYGMGPNQEHQLGSGNKINYPDGKLILRSIKEVDCGDYHTMALTTNGEIYVWGSNSDGQLGLGDGRNILVCIPHKILSWSNVKSIKCGTRHSVACVNDDEWYIWGSNYYGELGMGNDDNQYMPRRISLGNIKLIECGDSCTFALTLGGDVYAWGFNCDGRLGLGDTENRNVPERLVLDSIVSIKCGYYHSLALRANGDVYTWYDFNGLKYTCMPQIPHKINISNIILIHCSADKNIVIDKNGKIYMGDKGNFLFEEK